MDIKAPKASTGTWSFIHSCALLQDPEDAALLRRIVGQADVWVQAPAQLLFCPALPHTLHQNLAPGATERAGFGSDALREASMCVVITGHPHQSQRKMTGTSKACDSGHIRLWVT